MEQIRAAEYRARQFATQQLAENKVATSQQTGEGAQAATGSPASAQNPTIAAAVQGTNYAMHGSPMPPQGPQVSIQKDER